MSGPAELPLVARAGTSRERIAVVDSVGSYTYGELLDASARVAAGLLAGEPDLAERRVAFLLPPGFSYVAAQWGIWRAGGIAVPLSPLHPRPEIEHVLQDCGAELAVGSGDAGASLGEACAAHGIRYLTYPNLSAVEPAPLPVIDERRRAMILYTSGTTSRPKGAVTTHAGLRAQVESLVEAWEWGPDDRILHVLPLHHIHGVVNGLTCALWSGAAVEFFGRFDAAGVWDRIARDGITLFMAVPTIYDRLIAAWEASGPDRQAALSEAASRLRLMVSGSAALPAATLERWREITGHTLLERYGMTEIGMALSNPLRGRREPGRVGTPLPGVEVRLVDEGDRLVPPGEPGEIQVRGPGVFREYWGQPEATAAAFSGDWFRTGDVAVVEDGSYRMLGRRSVDIIKTGGYKVSALEVEAGIAAHPCVRECAVVGLPDREWGERVAAAVVWREGEALSLEQLRDWARASLAPYKLPGRLLSVPEIPRNAMGKISRAAVLQLFEEADASPSP